MTTDEKIRDIGKRVYAELFNKTPCEDWDYCSSLLYGKKLVQYSHPYPYSFYDQEGLDDNSYANKFKEVYGERTYDEVWLEMKTELISDLQRLTLSKSAIISIINQY